MSYMILILLFLRCKNLVSKSIRFVLRLNLDGCIVNSFKRVENKIDCFLLWEIWFVKKIVEDCEKLKEKRFEKKKVREKIEKEKWERVEFLKVVSEKYNEWLEGKKKLIVEERRIK